MKKGTIAIIGVGALAAFYVLSRKSSSDSGGGGSSGLGSIADNAMSALSPITGSVENLLGTGENLSQTALSLTDAMNRMLNGLADVGDSMGRTAKTMADTTTMGAETLQNVISVPNAFSKTFSNAGTNVAQFMNNFPTYVTKTDLTKPFDALSKLPQKAGLKGQANAGDAVKNFLSGRWW